MVTVRKRRRHAGTLAFVFFVLAADIVAAFMSFLYGATVGAWAIYFFPWLGRSVLTYFHGDLVSLLFILCLLLTVSIASLFRSLVGGCSATLALLLLWIVIRFAFHVQLTAPFLPAFKPEHTPAFQYYLAHRNTLLGWIWVAIYLVLHISIHHDPDAVIPEVEHKTVQQKQRVAAQRLAAQRLAAQRNGLSTLLESTLATNGTQGETVVLNPIHINEEKWRILNECLKSYHKALTRFYTVPIQQLIAPNNYLYVTQGNTIIWRGRTPILTEFLLNPANGQYLLVEFARALFAYNSTDLWLRQYMQFYAKIGYRWIALCPFGIFLVLPMLIKHLLGWQDWRATRILNADRFAWVLGQGELLLHQLRQRQIQGQEETDPNAPTLTERMGQLEGLLHDEHKQIQQQGIPDAESLAGKDTARSFLQ